MTIKMKTRMQKSSIYETANDDDDNMKLFVNSSERMRSLRCHIGKILGLDFFTKIVCVSSLLRPSRLGLSSHHSVGIFSRGHATLELAMPVGPSVPP